jgi:RNA polymerase sigma factor (sigma-70 family)
LGEPGGDIVKPNHDRIVNVGPRTLGELSAICHDPRNPSAWEEFLGRYQPKVIAYCRARGLSAQDAEVVTSDVLFTLFKKLPERKSPRERERFPGWLKRVIRNQAIDLHRRHQARGRTELDPAVLALLESPDPGPVETLIMMEKDLELREALNRVSLTVSRKHWDAFSRVESGESNDQVAAALEMSVQAVSMARYRIRRKLAEELGPEFKSE